MKNQYHVGELADYFGVSNDTLRLYDKMGILSPKKDPDNGYRVYSRADMICMGYIMQLRKTGLDLETIRKLVNEGSIGQALEVMDRQCLSLEKQISELQTLLEITRDYQKGFRSTVETLNTVSIRTSPRMICRRIEDSMFDIMMDFSSLAPGRMPRVAYIVPLDIVDSNMYEEELATCDAMRWYEVVQSMVLIDGKEEIEIPAGMADRFTVLPPRKCVFSSFACRTGHDYSAYVRIKKFALENGMAMCGDLVSVSVTMRNNNRASVDYYQGWLPVA